MSTVPTTSPTHLLKLNPDVDRAEAARRFARDGRVQIRDVLLADSAHQLRAVLLGSTQWGLAWQAGSGPPSALRAEELAALPPEKRNALGHAVARAAGRGEYAFAFARYPMVDAYLQRWNPGSAHDLLLEHINDEPFMGLVRTVTAITELVKADAQATLFAPSHFLAEHTDSHMGEGWRVAYVLSLAPDEWRSDWGGYLNFYDEHGDIVAGYKPRFNALSLFRVPSAHAVGYVTPFAPPGRLSITGWFRDR